MPVVAQSRCPGFAFASAISSGIVRASKACRHMKVFGVTIDRKTGRRSFSVS